MLVFGKLFIYAFEIINNIVFCYFMQQMNTKFRYYEMLFSVWNYQLKNNIPLLLKSSLVMSSLQKVKRKVHLQVGNNVFTITSLFTNKQCRGKRISSKKKKKRIVALCCYLI